ncbi:MAG: hypothetical protein PHT48_09535 [Dechloromonas sp.]|nr:hypothetical protein [Dechloromonas sp.]
MNDRKLGEKIIRAFGIDPTYVKEMTIRLNAEDGIKVTVISASLNPDFDTKVIADEVGKYKLVKK